MKLYRAIELAKVEIEKEGEGFVYEAPDLACVNYRMDGTPSCLVGRMLDAEGLITFQSLSKAELVGATVTSLSVALKLNLPEDTLKFLQILQRNQDEGTPWGAAFRGALEALGLA
jgi:hypothetical protein